MKITNLILYVALICFSISEAVAQQLISGPMVGHVTMNDARIWLQTDTKAEVSVTFYPLDSATYKRTTPKVSTKESEVFTTQFLLKDLQPGTKYTYHININGKKQSLPYPTQFTTQALWQYRTDPPEFTIAMGSCTYINEPEYDRPGTPYGGDYHIFNTIDSLNPDLMMWLGDNIYMREIDLNKPNGFAHRYTHTRSTKELQPLLAARPNYAIWDDHDFGPNDADGSFIYKSEALDYFKLFWANPSYGMQDFPGIFSTFTFQDIQFFLMDNRTYRTPKWERKEMRYILGREQTEWLLAALKNSRAPYKLVCIGGQVLNTATEYENHSQFPSERNYLLKRIAEEKIQGVVFLTGDRHHTELSEYTTESDIVMWDITSSPLTSRANSRVSESNENRVMGTLVKERNFTTIDVTGTRLQRKLTVRTYSSDGALLWEREIIRP